MVPLKSIKVGGKKLISVKLFFIAKSRRILKIRRPRLIRIYYRYKSSLVLSKSSLVLSKSSP
jgi:hypothetical protein